MRKGLVKKTGVFFRDCAIPSQMPGLLNAIGYDGARPRKNQPSSFWLREGHRLDEILYDVHILYRQRAKQMHSDITGGSDTDIKHLNLVYQRIKKIINSKLQPRLHRLSSIEVPMEKPTPCHCGCGRSILTSKVKPFFDENCRANNQRRIWRKASEKRNAKRRKQGLTTCSSSDSVGITL